MEFKIGFLLTIHGLTLVLLSDIVLYHHQHFLVLLHLNVPHSLLDLYGNYKKIFYQKRQW